MNDKLTEAYYYYRYMHWSKIKYSEPICIFGVPRGGTTWLAEILCHVYDARLIWEPLFKYKKYKFNALNPFAYPERAVFKEWNPYISPQSFNKEYIDFFENLFSLEIRNLKLLRFNDFKTFGVKNNNLFKFCFGNLALPWISENFNIKAIHLIRHPCAVISSSLDFGKQFNFHKKNYKNWRPDPKNLHPEFYGQFDFVHKLINSPESMMAVQWVIHNHFLVSNGENHKKWITVAYENLYSNPVNEINKITDFVGLKILNENFAENIKSESSSSKSGHALEQIQSGIQHTKWKSKLSTEQQRNIFKVLEAFEIDYYTTDSMPTLDKLNH